MPARHPSRWEGLCRPGMPHHPCHKVELVDGTLHILGTTTCAHGSIRMVTIFLQLPWYMILWGKKSIHDLWHLSFCINEYTIYSSQVFKDSKKIIFGSPTRFSHSQKAGCNVPQIGPQAPSLWELDNDGTVQFLPTTAVSQDPIHSRNTHPTETLFETSKYPGSLKRETVSGLKIEDWNKV